MQWKDNRPKKEIGGRMGWLEISCSIILTGWSIEGIIKAYYYGKSSVVKTEDMNDSK